jgi:hypothetical protein
MTLSAINSEHKPESGSSGVYYQEEIFQEADNPLSALYPGFDKFPQIFVLDGEATD